MSRSRFVRPLIARSLPLLAATTVLLAGLDAHAQYLRGSPGGGDSGQGSTSGSAWGDRDGYLSDRPRDTGDVASYGPPQEPWLKFNGALDLGMAYHPDFDDLDFAFFEPNGVAPMGGLTTMVLNYGGWFELSGAMRLGLQGGFGVGGDGRTDASLGNFGFLIEGGAPISQDWKFWGGALLGWQGVEVQARDSANDVFYYESDNSLIQGQIRFEYRAADWLRLRLSAYLGFVDLIEEVLDAPAGNVTTGRPAAFPSGGTGSRSHGGGITFGLVFGP